MRLELKNKAQSKLGYIHIEILIPNIDGEWENERIVKYHLCNTERGLVPIAADDLLRDLEHYRRLYDRNDLSHVLKGSI